MPALAATIPPSVEPGVLDRPYQEKKETPQGDVIVPIPDAPQPPQDAPNLALIPTSFEVFGSTVFSTEELAGVFDDLLGKKVGLAEIYARTARITDKYAEAGYALCIAFLPPQRIKNGKVRIEVVEGHIDTIAYAGDTESIPVSAQSYLAKLTRSKPLGSADLERYLLLANDVPGLSVRSLFERSDAGRGATRLIVDAEHEPVAAVLQVSNRGSKAIGREQAQGEVAFNSPFGLGEKWSVFAAQAFEFEELSYVQGRVSFPAGDEGLRLYGIGSYSESDPGTADLDALNFVSNGWTGELGVEFPLVRSRAANLTLNAALTGKVLDSDLLGLSNSSDRLYILSGSAAYTHRSGSGQTQAAVTVYQGTDLFNATTKHSPNKSRDGGSAVFSAITLDLSHEKVLSPGISAVAAFSGQAASRALLASEECGYGAEPFGRGFDPSEIAGDHCLKGLVELRAAPFLFMKAPNALGHVSRTLIAHAFFDAGIVWQEGMLFPGEVREESAQSFGGGIRLELLPRIEASVEYAHPLSRDVALEGNRDGRVFFTLRASY